MGRGLKPSKGRQAQVIATHESKNDLMAWIKESPLKLQQGQVVAAIIRWFLKQEPYVKTAVLSGIDRGMEMAYAAALRQLAEEIENPPMRSVLTVDSTKATESSSTESTRKPEPESALKAAGGSRRSR